MPVMDEGQYLRQTAGWLETWQYLQQIVRNYGPFDGVMGYSQVCTKNNLQAAYLWNGSA